MSIPSDLRLLAGEVEKLTWANERLAFCARALCQSLGYSLDSDGKLTFSDLAGDTARNYISTPEAVRQLLQAIKAADEV